MDLTHIRTVLEIIRTGSFSEAAVGLRISQPAVSLHVQRLERGLGARLLDRGGSQVRLTPHGEAFLRHARRIIDAEAEMREEIARLSHDLSGTIRVAASTIPGEFLLPGMLADFNALHPSVAASLTISDSEAVIEQLESRSCDVGFTGAPAQRHGVQQEPIYRDTLVLVVPADHPFAQRSSVRVDELAGQRVIARESGSGTMSSIQRILAESRRAAGTMAAECRSWINAGRIEWSGGGAWRLVRLSIGRAAGRAGRNYRRGDHRGCESQARSTHGLSGGSDFNALARGVHIVCARVARRCPVNPVLRQLS